MCGGRLHPERQAGRLEDATVIHPWRAARSVRQHRLDGSLLIVGEFVMDEFEIVLTQMPYVGGTANGPDDPELPLPVHPDQRTSSGRLG
jgi:hypothetical protein